MIDYFVSVENLHSTLLRSGKKRKPGLAVAAVMARESTEYGFAYGGVPLVVVRHYERIGFVRGGIDHASLEIRNRHSLRSLFARVQRSGCA